MLDPDTRSDLRPTATRVCNDVHISTRVVPANLAAYGGDWCEAFSLSQDIVALSIGDVCGHGPAMFEAMTMIRQVVRNAAHAGMPPDAVLNAANRFVCTHDPELLATALFALLDTKLAKVTFSNAGHPPPLIVDAGEPAFVRDHRSDLPLGVESVLSPALHTEMLPPGALLVFYTDGVTERDRDMLRGEQELCAAAHVAHQVADLSAASIIAELLCLSGSNSDDAALLTVSIPTSRAVKRFEADDVHGYVYCPPSNLFKTQRSRSQSYSCVRHR